MNMMFKAFAKKLFGEKYERLIKTLLICMIVFSGLRISGFRIQIAPVILYLTVLPLLPVSCGRLSVLTITRLICRICLWFLLIEMHLSFRI